MRTQTNVDLQQFGVNPCLFGEDADFLDSEIDGDVLEVEMSLDSKEWETVYIRKKVYQKTEEKMPIYAFKWVNHMIKLEGINSITDDSISECDDILNSSIIRFC